ncbi:hypothetical protein O9993_18230 [Vibrio lentus]|nr:hypothetical protein [Vibrio lentus]
MGPSFADCEGGHHAKAAPAGRYRPAPSAFAGRSRQARREVIKKAFPPMRFRFGVYVLLSVKPNVVVAWSMNHFTDSLNK